MAKENAELHRFTAADFFTGTICALIVGGRTRLFTVRDESVHSAFLELFKNELQEEAEKNSLDIRFRIALNAVYGISQTVCGGLSQLITTGVLTIELYGTLLPRFNPDTAETTLQSLPGTPEMYKRFATRFEELLRP